MLPRTLPLLYIGIGDAWNYGANGVMREKAHLLPFETLCAVPLALRRDFDSLLINALRMDIQGLSKHAIADDDSIAPLHENDTRKLVWVI